MKKIIAICLCLLIAASATVTAFAAPANFWGSPAGKPTPKIIAVTGSDDTTVQLVLTPYSERKDMTDSQIDLINKAYDSIANAKSLTELNADLADAVAKLAIESKYLAVTNLFDIHLDGDNQSQNAQFQITLTVDGLENFVGLLHMNKDGVWEFVPGAYVDESGKNLVFTTDDFSPFAIVVDTTGESPKTGDSVMIISTIVLSGSVIALAVITFKRKKQIAQ